MYNGIMFPTESQYVSPFGSEAAKRNVMKNVKYIPVPKEGNEDTFAPKKKMSENTKFGMKMFGGFAALGVALYSGIKNKSKLKEILSNFKRTTVKETTKETGKNTSGIFKKAKTQFKTFFARFKKGANAKKMSSSATAASEVTPLLIEATANKSPKALPYAGELVSGASEKITPAVTKKTASALSEAAENVITKNLGESAKLPQIPREILLGKTAQPFAAEIAAREAGKAAGIILPPTVTEVPKKGVKNTIKSVISKIEEKLPRLGKKATEEGVKKPGLGSIIKDTIGRHFFKR